MNQIGIDVSNDVLDATRQHGEAVHRRTFHNTPAGHRAFVRWARHGAERARVCLEATGVYYLQLALTLDRQAAIELMVVNPCAARRFVQAHMVRAKTDAIDADGLLLFLQRMPFKPWSAPRLEVLQLQSLARRMAQLDKEITRERSRLHAARRAGPHCRWVQQDIRNHIKQLQQRQATMQRHAGQVIGDDPVLQAMAQRIVSIPGFAQLSAIRLVAELAALPDDMTPAQWVAHAGLVATQHEPHVAAFYQNLLARGKPKMVALTAVMRRFLHALWGMQYHQETWDGNKFYCIAPA
jgi:transposase